MKTFRHFTLALIALSAAALPLLLTGAFSRVTAQSPNRALPFRVEKIVVMPLVPGSPGPSARDTLDSPLDQFYSDPEQVSADASLSLTRHVQYEIRRRHGQRAVQFQVGLDAYEKLAKDEGKDTPRGLAQKLGAALQANAVITGFVWRYVDRIGGEYGVQRPAAIAFQLYLIDAATGTPLWRGGFEEKQRSLSERPLEAAKFFQRRGRWVTIDELAEQGLQEAFSDYPY